MKNNFQTGENRKFIVPSFVQLEEHEGGAPRWFFHERLLPLINEIKDYGDEGTPLNAVVGLKDRVPAELWKKFEVYDPTFEAAIMLFIATGETGIYDQLPGGEH